MLRARYLVARDVLERSGRQLRLRPGTSQKKKRAKKRVKEVASKSMKGTKKTKACFLLASTVTCMKLTTAPNRGVRA
jgi:hypothetical protein